MTSITDPIDRRQGDDITLTCDDSNRAMRRCNWSRAARLADRAAAHFDEQGRPERANEWREQAEQAEQARQNS